MHSGGNDRVAREAGEHQKGSRETRHWTALRGELLGGSQSVLRSCAQRGGSATSSVFGADFRTASCSEERRAVGNGACVAESDFGAYGDGTGDHVISRGRGCWAARVDSAVAQ